MMVLWQQLMPELSCLDPCHRLTMPSAWPVQTWSPRPACTAVTGEQGLSRSTAPWLRSTVCSLTRPSLRELIQSCAACRPSVQQPAHWLPCTAEAVNATPIQPRPQAAQMLLELGQVRIGTEAHLGQNSHAPRQELISICQ